MIALRAALIRLVVRLDRAAPRIDHVARARLRWGLR